MKKFRMTLVVIVSLLCSLSNAMAYSATPWEGTAKVGETQTNRGYIAKLAEDSTSYVVIVMGGCNSGYVVLYASAEEGIVSDKQLGKQVQITAKLIKKEQRRTVLRILRVQNNPSKQKENNQELPNKPDAGDSK